jgi:nucleotide-binding universal stress UspA family protein
VYKNILLPTDGSPLARNAVQNGVRLAKAVGAKVTGFYAAPPPTPLEYRGIIPVGYMTPERHAKLIEKTAARILGDIEEAAKAAGVRCNCVYVTDDFPAEAIVAAAKKHKCDLIYMASHGRRGFRGLHLGSQTQKVLENARVPVLVDRVDRSR